MKHKIKIKGQILPVVIYIMLFLMIVIPALIEWTSNQTRWSMKQQRKTVAFNLAEAGIDRGVWKLKSSTSTWAQAASGVIIPGYNFDVIYDDISGGNYRIKFSSGPSSGEVTIISEGRDSSTSEIRAIKAVYKNQTIPGAMISKGIITWANAFSAHWGPIMAHGNINITDANAARDYFPRKFSRQVVSAVPSYPRDTNGLNPPNTDNIEWWSDYPVPELPVLDFAALRSSAAVNVVTYLEYDGEDSVYTYYRWKRTYPIGSSPPSNWISSATINTLNVIGCSKMTNYTGPKWWIRYRRRKTTGEISEAATLSTCNVGGTNHNGLRHFQNSYYHPAARDGRVWYWDPGADVVFTGSTGNQGGGIIGDIIVRSNLTNYWGDNLTWQDIGLSNCRVPSEAWKEYTIIHKTGSNTYYDTTAINEYPADDGLRRNRSTFRFGAETWTVGQNPPDAANTDVGLVGFLYVGGNFNIERAMDYYGAVWVVGNVSRASGVAEQSIIFFKDDLDLPSLNVVLTRKHWEEIKPSDLTW